MSKSAGRGKTNVLGTLWRASREAEATPARRKTAAKRIFAYFSVDTKDRMRASS